LPFLVAVPFMGVARLVIAASDSLRATEVCLKQELPPRHNLSTRM
jgi:hypothetical protein